MGDDGIKEKNDCTCHQKVVVEYNQAPACLDYKKTVIAQYSNSPIMLQLLDYFDQNNKVCGFFEDFYRVIWNINTAEGVGLDIWGRIVGTTRTARSFNGFFWGYNEATLLLSRPYYDISGYNESLKKAGQIERYNDATGTFRDGFIDANGQDHFTGRDLMREVTFNDEDFRKLILAKAFANISDYSISNINFLLMALLGNNKSCDCSSDNGCHQNDNDCYWECQHMRTIYVQDNLDMTLTIKLDWLPTSREVALIYNTGILSKPAGVGLEIDIKVKKR